MYSSDIKIPGVLAVHPTGSREICNPPPIETDDDYIVLVRDIEKAELYLETSVLATSEGSEPDDMFGNDSSFVSMRLGEVNFILTQDLHFFSKFVLATKVARKLNLLKKDDRICLFQAILYGNEPEELLM